MIKAVVSGAGGRMGSGIIARMAQDDRIEVAGALEAPGHPDVGKVVNGVEVASDIEKLADWDVIVEFASPAAALAHIPVAAAKNKKAVVGTTGFSADELQRLRGFGESMPLLISPNMSLGVNILLKIAGIASRALGEDFDIEVVEMHHSLKKDSPSGTAARIAEVIAGARDLKIEDKAVYGRHAMELRRKSEIGVHAVRGGTVAGEHTVIFAGESERLEITHRAETRDIFVLGTIKAVKFISAVEKAGIYSMEDVIG